MKKEKITNSNPSKKRKERAKRTTWHWLTKKERLMYWNIEKPTDALLDEVADEYLKWADSPNAFKITDFTTELGVIYPTFKNWTERHEGLRLAHEYAKDKLGSYRERLSVFRDYNCNPGTLNFVMGHYCHVWRGEKVFDSELRTQEKDSSHGDITIHMDSYEDEGERDDKSST